MEAVIKLQRNRGNNQDSYETLGIDLESIREAEGQWNWWYHLAVKYRKKLHALFECGFSLKEKG